MPKKKSGPKERLVRTETIEVRLFARNKSKLKWLARTYAGGNMSKWVEYAIEAAPRKVLK